MTLAIALPKQSSPLLNSPVTLSASVHFGHKAPAGKPHQHTHTHVHGDECKDGFCPIPPKKQEKPAPAKHSHSHVHADGSHCHDAHCDHHHHSHTHSHAPAKEKPAPSGNRLVRWVQQAKELLMGLLTSLWDLIKSPFEDAKNLTGGSKPASNTGNKDHHHHH